MILRIVTSFFVWLLLVNISYAESISYKASIEVLSSPNNSQAIIHFKLNDGYKIYYKSSGFFGTPPLVLQDSKALDLQYSIPRRNIINGYDSFIYNDKAYFLIKELDPLKALNIEYAICNKNCLYEQQTIKPKIINSSEYNLQLNNIKPLLVKDTATQISLTIYSQFNKILFELENYNAVNDLIIESNKYISSKLKITPSKITGEILFSGDLDQTIQNLIKESPPITLLYNNQAEQFKPIYTIKLQSPSNNIFYILFLSFIGGIILNLMPCILPVILLKCSHLSNSRNFKSSLFYSFGIISSMLAIALLQIFLRLHQQEFLFGMQLQNPLFVMFIIMILVISLLIMKGKMFAHLPSFINNLLNKLKSRELQNFFEGFVLTLIAIPCSAPFIGASLGYSLTSSYLESVSIFLALGLGFSTPILLLNFYYPTSKIKTNQLFKLGNLFQKLSFLALIITTLWLSYIYYTQVAEIAFVCSMLILALFIICTLSRIKKLLKQFFQLTLLLTLILIPQINLKTQRFNEPQSNIIEFNTNELRSLLNNDSLVLVEITASWCLTCKVNRLTVLDSKQMHNYFKENNILIMQGDLSIKNEKIIRFINHYNRAALPFYALFYKDIEKPIILSEILSEQEIKTKLQQIKQLKKN
ncbi:cytochrome c biogenesis protein CcdA [Rickettsiales endosymbiont of Stachyamoeba lipophora]|uniref:cytochrome c biogenesis protein CcdA n=1 Tax=Rickettsiales endosymbiont of Stachyamoeba lipophora TaxID=2486578 RepID=UPI000F6499F4|nr:thioredoxin family protein [Rickettsiales endosymbiont of Stachyamoeba lipophora]AZL16175.1 hypothetical protein EF513_06495 [Rickettsiales endosymbiont of Stachyamoeba lipophora]